MNNPRIWESQASPKVTSVAVVDDEIDLLDLARTLWRGKLWIILAAVIAGLLGYAYATYLVVPKYTTEAVVALENRQETVIAMDSVLSGLSGDQATINTETEVLRSRNLIGALVDEMSLVDDPEFNDFLRSEDPVPADAIVRDATIDAVLDAIAVSNLRNSYVYKLTVVTTSPEKSRDMANMLADLYLQDQLTVKFEATAQASAWLNERVAKLKTDLEQSEAEVQAFVANTDLISADALEGLSRQIKDSRDRLMSLGESRNTLLERIAAMEAAEASGELLQMQSTVAGASYAVRLTLGDAQAEAEFRAAFAADLDRSRVDLARTTAQIASLGASVIRLEQDFDQQSQDLVTLEQLEREALATRSIYEYFLTRLKETSAQEGIQQADSRILSFAPLPTRASEPRRMRILALSVLVGLFLGGGGVLLREMLHTGFRNAEDLEQMTGITVMGQLPRIPSRTRKGVIEYLIEKPTSAAAEAVRNLRTSLLLSDIDNPPKVILSTSSVPSEGKTTTAISLAQNFTGLGKSVLLIEGDIRRKIFSEYFELDENRGLLSVLSGAATFDDVVQRLDMIDADILIGEKSSTNAADVFSSDKFHAFIKDMRARYDVVIIDTPPVLLVPDARIIAQTVDSILLTVQWDQTSRAQVREAVRQFQTAGRPITGLVLSQIDPKGMKRYGYGDRYGAYSTYGGKYYDT